jgi:transcription factor SOX7/8/10/18 (SOX group E/F)
MFPGQPEPTQAPADEDWENAHRPPNAFILYSQAMRSAVRQENPTLSNTEVSGLLGKMWREVPADVKMPYKQKASIAQEQFKRDHPNYTYRKARRKRALNELLTKNAQGFQIPVFGADPNLQAMMAGAANPYLAQMYGQAPGPGGQIAPQQGWLPDQFPPRYPGLMGAPDRAQPGGYQRPRK